MLIFSMVRKASTVKWKFSIFFVSSRHLHISFLCLALLFSAPWMRNNFHLDLQLITYPDLTQSTDFVYVQRDENWFFSEIFPSLERKFALISFRLDTLTSPFSALSSFTRAHMQLLQLSAPCIRALDWFFSQLRLTRRAVTTHTKLHSCDNRRGGKFEKIHKQLMEIAPRNREHA